MFVCCYVVCGFVCWSCRCLLFVLLYDVCVVVCCCVVRDVCCLLLFIVVLFVLFVVCCCCVVCVVCRFLCFSLCRLLLAWSKLL